MRAGRNSIETVNRITMRSDDERSEVVVVPNQTIASDRDGANNHASNKQQFPLSNLRYSMAKSNEVNLRVWIKADKQA